MTRLVEGKNAIIYGARGGIGRGVARTFAREGARLFLAGRTKARLDAVARRIAEEGGQADLAGSLDVSWNLTSRGDVQGIPLIDMTLADFLQPITAGASTSFLTARAAARIMVEQGSGVILAITSGSSAGTNPMMGGTGPADAPPRSSCATWPRRSARAACASSASGRRAYRRPSASPTTRTRPAAGAAWAPLTSTRCSAR